MLAMNIEYNKTYDHLKKQILGNLAGEISAAELKHDSAPLGIYQQRNNLFMMRIRVTGGQIPVDKLAAIADIMDSYNVGFSHITSRQDLQLQDVAPLAIHPILKKLLDAGLPFKGGGGDTFRNILVSSESGVSKNDVFDVYPYAEQLKKFLFKKKKAFALPRKLKIGFSSNPDDSIKAIMQDLGFIAKIKNGKKGFEVYAGGGMGKNSMVGLKLADFISLQQYLKCTKAITELFYDHGDRSDRQKARLRFVVQRLGAEKFLDLYQEYFAKTSSKTNLDESKTIADEVKLLKTMKMKIPQDHAYSQWLTYAVSNTKFGNSVKTLRLFVPYGNFKAEQLRKLSELAVKCGVNSLRLTQGQDIIFPIIHKSFLPFVFKYFHNELESLDLTVLSFKGHITSCIGANVCKIGIADSPGLSDRIADALDKFFADKPEKKADAVLPVLKNLKVSGCPNACSGHAVSKFGLQGMKKKNGEKLKEGALVFTDGFACQNKASLAQTDKQFIDKEDLGKIIAKLIGL